MPVKKTISSAEPESVRRKKSSSASKAKAHKNKIPLKKATRTEKARIQKAIDSLPNLVIETSASAPMQKPAKNSFLFSSQPKVSHLNPLSFRSEFEEKKKRIVWLSVGTIMIFIFSLWVVNVRAQFTDADFHLGTEELLLNQAKEDFSSLVRTPEPKPVIPAPEPQQDVEKIKQVLSENLLYMSATSSSTTSTTEYTATSSVFTSSTEYIILESDNTTSFEE